MSESDKKTGGVPDLSDIDWDSALDEWESKTFMPEVAKDRETEKAAGFTGPQSKPLYRPPTPAAGQPPSASRMPKAAPIAPPPEPVVRELPELPAEEDEEEGSGATVIAAIPRELLRGAGKAEAPPSARGGGLGQLFAKTGEHGAVRLPEPERLDKATSRPPPLEGEEEADSLITSAKHVPRPAAREKNEEILRRPSQVDPHEAAVGEGELFNPFVEPPTVSRPTPAPLPPGARLEDLAPPEPSGRATPIPSSSSGEEETQAEAHEMDDAAAVAMLEDLETTIANEGSGAAAPETGPDGLAEALAAEESFRPPPLLAPEQRRFDPNEETFILSKQAIANRSIDLVKVGEEEQEEEEDNESTHVRTRSDSQLDALPLRAWQDERPASAWLDDARREAFASRGAWLEAEARAMGDKMARARGLLAASEIAAIVGDDERAAELAGEARDLAPQLALAHRQVRGLVPAPREAQALVELLDQEAKSTPGQAGRVHAAMLAAEALRASGDEDGATRRYDQSFRVSPGDVRAPLARAARALARGETQSPALRMPDAPELAPLGAALGVALRLRGVERKDLAGEPPPNDLLRRARIALDKGDVVGAANLVAELRVVPELARGASWLAAALGASRVALRADAAKWLHNLVTDRDDLARRALAARAIELGDPALVEQALSGGTTFSPAERATLTALVGLDLAHVTQDLDLLGANEGLMPLAAALAAIDNPTSEEAAKTRAARVAGDEQARRSTTLGRLLAWRAKDDVVEHAVAAFGAAAPPEVKVVALEMAVRANRYGDVSDAVGGWAVPTDVQDAERDRLFGSAVIAERAGDAARALAAYRAVAKADPASEAALRAVAAIDPEADLATALGGLADELGEGARSALARLESVARAEAAGKLEAAERAERLEKAHRAAPQIPVAAFLAERNARNAGDLDGVLRWLRERRANVHDPLEGALDAVREALLVADSDHTLASERLEEAHRARPADIALRELYERLAVERPADGAQWREQRAAQATGESRELLLVEAAYEYERTGDRDAALRSAQAAAASAGDKGLAKVVRERAELEASQVARLADELLAQAKSASDPVARRDAYERLAAVDEVGRADHASALLWHRSILEEFPAYKPSLRHVEHALVSEGRDDELEAVAAQIAKMLAGGEGAEGVAHAELAARLRLRGGDWEGTREMIELALQHPEPSLWALRMQMAHARGRGDDRGFIASVEALLERMTRPQEIAALLVRAGEAASRHEDLPRARELLERAATEDPGDVVTWGLLADVRQRAGDARGAAEACESLARCSVVPEHQLLAWYDAGRMWLDEVKDEERGIIALEQAAAIDVGFQDTFERLKQAYTAKKSQGELASLLERRIEKITDENERIGMEIERGRVLLEVGDQAGARTAFEAALAVRPEDPVALGLFAELCAQEREWSAAEQAWVRLARLLPTPEEQRKVFARLGDLYSTHAINLSRAEVALKEVLKRAPDDLPTMERLVEVYRRQNDSARAVELQQELINRATTTDEKRKRLVELSGIFESTGHDNRKAEQTLEAARRAYPNDVHVLRALADFYRRHNQLPAVNVLLDRAQADVKRALGAGRFTPALFETMQAVHELRGKKDAAKLVGATLGALEGRSTPLGGGEGRALDPRLDEALAPEAVTPGVRALLRQAGDALEAAFPLDPRSVGATTLGAGGGEIAALARRFAEANGLSVQVFVATKIELDCVAVIAQPSAIVLGEALVSHENAAAREFMVARAIKLLLSRAAPLARGRGPEIAVALGAWLQAFNPSWKPEGVPAASLADAGRRVQAALPRNLGPDVGVLALEIAGQYGAQPAALAASLSAWADRAALLALGDPNAALDAIAMREGIADASDRAALLGRSPAARDLVAFSVSDVYADLRSKLNL